MSPPPCAETTMIRKWRYRRRVRINCRGICIFVCDILMCIHTEIVVETISVWQANPDVEPGTWPFLLQPFLRVLYEEHGSFTVAFPTLQNLGNCTGMFIRANNVWKRRRWHKDFVLTHTEISADRYLQAQVSCRGEVSAKIEARTHAQRSLIGKDVVRSSHTWPCLIFIPIFICTESQFWFKGVSSTPGGSAAKLEMAAAGSNECFKGDSNSKLSKASRPVRPQQPQPQPWSNPVCNGRGHILIQCIFGDPQRRPVFGAGNVLAEGSL